ncbi:uncharacterized protein LOC110813949 [Carica papaya]|uniref:uncharacterized protein LOC110813949 n=1 Tax=Carica papaya TaxID=3649 RepID=UPI000B8CD9FE|nr:uncharacterized protein LOC110813949 [Carica papaya]
MANLKLSSKLTKLFPIARSRVFVTAARPLQGRSKEADQCQNVKEAAEDVKEGAKQVKETTEFIRDTTASTARKYMHITKMTEKVSEATEAITEKAKGSMTGVLGVKKNLSNWFCVVSS